MSDSSGGESIDEISSVLANVLGGRLLRGAPLSLDEQQQTIASAALHVKAPALHSARSALRHLFMGWEIRGLDPEMAAFHAITASEEAATALFLSLKSLQYRNADRILHHNHVRKAALRPFFYAVERALFVAQSHGLVTQIIWADGVHPPVFRTRIRFPGMPEHLMAQPDPPLEFSIQLNDKLHSFVDEILAATNTLSADEAMKEIQAGANLRNQLLYASSTGLPFVNEIDHALLSSRDWTLRTLGVLLLVDQTRRPQLFVQQCLDSFLAFLNRLPDEDGNPACATPRHQ